MNDQAEIGTIDKEQKVAIDQLEEVLHFLKSVQIKDEDIIVNIKKPLDDLRSSLKYIPSNSLFKTIPTEIKTKILNNLCDSNAFIAAAVSLEWKQILGSRFTEKTVTIGKRCCKIQCQDKMCLKPAEMLKASATHRLDAHLSICDSVKKVDSKRVTDGLLSVSKFSLTGSCTRDLENNDNNDSFESNAPDCECDVNPLSGEQLEDLFKGLEKKDEVMDKVKLVCLDLNKLNQDKLIHCFLYKIKNLTLSDADEHKMLNFETLINKLSQESTESKLKKLTLYKADFPEELDFELANGLCNVETVKLSYSVNLRVGAIRQLIENIISDTHPVIIKTLEWRSFGFPIDTEDLKKLLNKLMKVHLRGIVTSEQLEAARSIPDVQVWREGFLTFIQKGLQHDNELI